VADQVAWLGAARYSRACWGDVACWLVNERPG